MSSLDSSGDQSPWNTWKHQPAINGYAAQEVVPTVPQTSGRISLLQAFLKQCSQSPYNKIGSLTMLCLFKLVFSA